ncbi:hypothetical protein EWM64_g4813, partial [Hericium alpestre]
GYGMAQRCADDVFAKAGFGIGEGRDLVGVVELHDCFAANELVTYGALRLCPLEDAWKFAERGDNTYGGKFVINPSGGLEAKGHPLGATGIGMHFYIAMQLRNWAGPMQAPGLFSIPDKRGKYGLVHNLGLGGAVVVSLLRRPEFFKEDIRAQPPQPKRPPAKKRKRAQNGRGRGRGGGRQYPQHWDDPGSAGMSMSYGGGAEGDVVLQQEQSEMAFEDAEVEEGEEEEREESRELTHEEVWDDSALVDAWESAMAEYEAFHGKGKSWKDEPAKKAPLSWYNVPPSPSKLKASQTKKEPVPAPGPSFQQTGTGAETSQPLDFATFMPEHDASLSLPGPPVPSSEYQLGDAGMGEWASKDEAFQRALGAMYWAGYWTAVYHSHAQGSNPREQQNATGVLDEDADAEFAGADEEMDEEELISTQR